MNTVDCIVVGAGVMGSAVARSLLLRKKVKSVAVLEKEAAPAQHTSGRNSGVVHAGFNLKPGSLKAKFCVEGNKRMREFCAQKKVPLESVGTWVVALEEKEKSVLEEIYKRGQANGVEGVRLVDGNEMRKHEPQTLGIAALHAPTGAITSGKQVTQALVEEVQSLGGIFFFGEKVQGIDEGSGGYTVSTSQGRHQAPLLFNCAGLYADEVAHKLDVGTQYTIVPFRGEYYKLTPEKSTLVNSMIYPVPDLNYPFLGVHWTKTITGELMIGPSATMAFGRESYKPLSVGWIDTLKMVTKENFWSMFKSKDFRRMAWSQIKMSLNHAEFIREAQKLVRGSEIRDFKPGKSGNRAQVVNETGKLVDDMLVEKKGTALHVLNAVSPGFTCALPFADHLVDTLLN
ncbi:MAG: L-2-hydroxyglutarate oxidase LhgO [Elusimicrobia bacterium]|nr:L-2-hydroxyglutarate oxidase LhgO [Elusimicrobiota bacterium]